MNRPSPIAPIAAVRDHCQQWMDAWNRFWFSPARPDVLCLLRILVGLLFLYCQVIWALNLADFLGPQAWITPQVARMLHAADFTWSYLWWTDSATILWLNQILTLLAGIAFLLGIATRISAPLAWFFQLMYVHRLTGTLFGFDQALTMMLMYLALAPCGARWSVDAWWRRRLELRGALSPRWQRLLPAPTTSHAANIATRLWQLHLCLIYLFGGISKMRGEMWWDGTALWFSVANLEYQSLDLTWIGRYPLVFSALSNLTIFWEAFYCALIWPRLTRPWTLAMAVAVHAGIALALGMITFGAAMITANGIFLSSLWLSRVTGGFADPAIGPQTVPVRGSRGPAGR